MSAKKQPDQPAILTGIFINNGFRQLKNAPLRATNKLLPPAMLQQSDKFR